MERKYKSGCTDAMRATAWSLGVFCLLVILGVFWLRASGSWNYISVLVATIPVAVIAVFAHFYGLLENETLIFRAYALILSYFCLVFVFIIPPMSSPDEGHHFFSSYWISDVVTGDATLQDGGSFPVREDVVEMYNGSSMAIGSSGYRRVFDSFGLFADSDEVVQVNQFDFSFGSENVAAKIPSVVGILIARGLNLGAYPLFYLGRLLAALFFVCCVLLAVHITPTAKAAFMGISLLPMSLQLAGSYSYDCGIIALCFLLSAVLLRSIFSNEEIGLRQAVTLFALVFLVAPLKIVYLSVLLLLLFIPQRRFCSRKYAFIFKLVVVISAIASIASVRLASISSLVGSGAVDSLDYRGTETGIFYSLNDLLSDPLGTAALFVRTFDVMGDFYIESMVGALPGWLQANLRAPNLLIYAYLGCLLLCVQKTQFDNQSISLGVRVAMIAACFLTFLGVSLSMAVGWTFNTEGVIQGVQGRYFLPMAPMALLALRSRDIEVQKSPYDICLVTLTFLNVIYLLRFTSIAFSLP